MEASNNTWKMDPCPGMADSTGRQQGLNSNDSSVAAAGTAAASPLWTVLGWACAAASERQGSVDWAPWLFGGSPCSGFYRHTTLFF